MSVKIGDLMEATSLLSKDLDLEGQEGKHLIFQLGERGYGIPILEISEINGLMDITPVPKTQDYIKGVINLRGKIIPVMDLRVKFKMPVKEYDEQTCIIISNLMVKNVKNQMGIIVDTVSEVFDIPLDEIEPPPSYGDNLEAGFLSGIGKVKGEVVMLVNTAKIVHSDEFMNLR